MKLKVLKFGALIPLLLVSSIQVFGKSTITVRVVDQNGTPQRKAEVSARGVNSGKTKKEKAGNDGVAHLKKLEDDYYRVWARQDGFSPAFKEFIHLTGDAQETIELTLQPGNKEQQLYFEDDQLAQQASKLLADGTQALHNQKFAQAETKLNEALKINPSQPVTYQNLGILYYHQRKWELARENLQEAVRLFAVFAAMKPSPTVAKQLEQAREMVALLPAQQLAAGADDALKANNFVEAAAKLRQLAELQPDNAGVFYNLTLALARGNRFDEAREAIDEAIRLEPQNESFKDTRRELDRAAEAAIAKKAQEAIAGVDELLQAGQHEAAIGRAEELRRSVPPEFVPVLWIATARANVKLERSDEAAAAFREAVELVPDKIEYRRELAEYLFKLERYEDAFGVFKEVWERSSEALDESFFKLGQDLIKRGKQDMARKAFERALETNPEYAEAYYELGMEYFYGLKNRPKAVEMLKKYLELGQDEAHLNNAKSVIVVIEKGH